LSDADGAVVEARLWHSTANHTTQLMPAVAEVLASRKLSAAELDGVAVALGPGPFSARTRYLGGGSAGSRPWSTHMVAFTPGFWVTVTHSPSVGFVSSGAHF